MRHANIGFLETKSGLHKSIY